MDVQQLLDTLQNMGTKRWKFAGMTYYARVVDFDFFLGDTALSGLVPLLEDIAQLGSPFYHHQLLFPMWLNGTLPDNFGEVLGFTGFRDPQMPFGLLIHLLRDGVQGRFVTMPPGQNLLGYAFVGPVYPSWVAAALGAVGQRAFRTPSWNCHHFAVHMFKSVARACTASGMFQCPPEQVSAAFPLTISPPWCLFWQAVGMSLLAILPSAGLLGLAFKLLKRFGEHDGGPAHGKGAQARIML
jgi:hypothetical protein